MKISVKLALYAAIITAVSIILCCTILLVTTANSNIQNTIDNGVAELNMLHNMFTAEMEVVGDKELSETAKRSLVLSIFRKYTDASVSGSRYILADVDETIYNDSPIDPRPLLPDLKAEYEQNSNERNENYEEWPYAIAELNGKRYFVAGHYSDNIGNMDYRCEIFLVRDITGVYQNIASMAVRFALVALAAVILTTFAMIALVRRMLRPLGVLKESAAAIAGGDFESRIKTHGKDEIAQLGTSFNTMAEAVSQYVHAINETSEQRKLLLAALTHELKTPMTAIIGYSDTLMRVNVSQQKRQEAVGYIHSECKRLERLAQKMMRLVTLHGGEGMDIHPQPVSGLFEAVDATINKIAEDRGMRVTTSYPDGDILAMDKDLLASVILNLFDNASKAGASEICIKADGRTITVEDDGGGIPADELAKVTQPFYMVDKSHSQSVGGSGLGLALCVLIVEAHGGTLSIESIPGLGTIVTLRFQDLQVDDMPKNT